MSVMAAVMNQTREESSRDANQKNSAMKRLLMCNGGGHGEEVELELQRQVQPRTRPPSWQPQKPVGLGWGWW